MTTPSWNDHVSGRADAAILNSVPATLLTPIVLGETVPRSYASFTATTTLVSGRLHLVSISLQQGVPVSKITFVSDSQAMVQPINWWFALFTSPGRVLCRQTADQGVTAWPAFGYMPVSLTAPYTPTYTGRHLLGVMCNVTPTTGIPPNLTAVAQPAHVVGVPPTTTGSSTTGLTSTAPNPAGGLTGIPNLPWAWVS